jgi:hypothetical protein
MRPILIASRRLLIDDPQACPRVTESLFSAGLKEEGNPMRSLEARLRRLERARGFGAKRYLHGRSEADLDRQEAELRRAGFSR